MLMLIMASTADCTTLRTALIWSLRRKAAPREHLFRLRIAKAVGIKYGISKKSDDIESSES